MNISELKKSETFNLLMNNYICSCQLVFSSGEGLRLKYVTNLFSGSDMN